jgi:hypothetical protein
VKIHQDFTDFIFALKKHNVEFVMVGSFDLAFHGHPRYTGDMDLWIRPTKSNATALIQAISDFGLGSIALTEHEILSGHVIQLGYPPVRIDLITVLDGVTSEEIWSTRQEGAFGKQMIFYLSKEAFIKNKRAIGRHKDLADLEALDEGL